MVLPHINFLLFLRVEEERACSPESIQNIKQQQFPNNTFNLNVTFAYISQRMLEHPFPWCILTVFLWNSQGSYCYPHFIDTEDKTHKTWNKLLKVIQPVNVRKPGFFILSLGFSLHMLPGSVLFYQKWDLWLRSAVIQIKAGMQSNIFPGKVLIQGRLLHWSFCWKPLLGYWNHHRNFSFFVSMLLAQSIHQEHEDGIPFLSNTQDSSRFHTYRMNLFTQIIHRDC